MPPVWVHASLALGAAAVVGFGVRRGRLAQTSAWLGLGFVWGAILPDADLIVSSLASAAAGFDTGVGEFLHRTMTHSLLSVAALLVAGHIARTPRVRLTLWGAAAGLGFLHILPDLFYLSPTKVLAPLSFEGIGPYGPLNNDLLSDVVKNRFTTGDFLGESYWYLLVWHLARRMGTENRWTRMLPWAAAVNAVVYLFFATRTTTYDYDIFLLYAYAAGFPFLVITTLLVPLGCRRTFLAVAGLKKSGRRTAAPTEASDLASAS